MFSEKKPRRGEGRSGRRRQILTNGRRWVARQMSSGIFAFYFLWRRKCGGGGEEKPPLLVLWSVIITVRSFFDGTVYRFVATKTHPSCLRFSTRAVAAFMKILTSKIIFLAEIKWTLNRHLSPEREKVLRQF